MTIGKRIQQLRKQKGLSQQDLANLINMSRQTIGKWEQDLYLPDLNSLIEMTEIFNVSINELIGIENEKEPVSEVYQKIETVLHNVQKSNRSRNILQIIIMIICVVSLVLTLSMKRQMDAPAKELESYIETQNYTQNMLKDYMHKQYSSVIQDLCLFSGPSTEVTQFNVSKFDIEKREVTLDFQIVLEEYSEDTEIQIIYAIPWSANSIELTFEKLSDNRFVLRETIPLDNYEDAKIYFKNINGSTKVATLSTCFYLKHVLNSQVWLYLPQNEVGQLQLNQLSYEPGFSHTYEKWKYEGNLHGELNVQFYNEDYEIIGTPIKIDLSKPSMNQLSESLPLNEKIYLKLDYILTDGSQGGFNLFNSNNTISIPSEQYFIIDDTSSRLDICHYTQGYFVESIY